jgi:hypothetical protein
LERFHKNIMLVFPTRQYLTLLGHTIKKAATQRGTTDLLCVTRQGWENAA